MRIVAVTACPTGIAHTYMAAEALEAAAQEAGHTIDVETQGSAGSTPLTAEQLAGAEVVILASDIEIAGRERFAHLPQVETGVKRAVSSADLLVAQAEEARADLDAEPPPPSSGPADPGPPPSAVRTCLHSTPATPPARSAATVRTWLMTGVSHMIPFVAAGGILIALGYALGGYRINLPGSAPLYQTILAGGFDAGSVTAWGALAFAIGTAAFNFLVPVLSGFIAHAMTGRPGLVPGFVGGAIAMVTGAGFLGGLVSGFVAGGLVWWIQSWRVPSALAGLMPVLVIPVLPTAVVGLLMFVVLGRPIAYVTSTLTTWLNGLSGLNAVLLGLLVGLMMCFDMGGPVNKAAYTFAVAGLSTDSPGALAIMAATMAAGMVPPLAMALATTVRPSLFTDVERHNGRAAWLLGASFITEGAVPFAAADPFRVIPSVMVGGAAAGGLSMAFGATLRAPHGGVFVVPLMGSPVGFLVAVVVGTAVAAALVVLVKTVGRPRRAGPVTAAAGPRESRGTGGTSASLSEREPVGVTA
jgi:fructose PTS system EIIBC or EIIC component